ncbi:ArsC family reductase [Uliginosibacterium sp. H3]|uniref:ArsC family reductase n=1 Tax=Uliginosibacterium silvisoli TaxID=3114758 RepID=A0ABU6K7R1_9RHOO|nr:ArsC family reductase [Uliginosibacterium sp. H3]
MTITLYGIPNCDTVKKARTWLSEQGIAYVFHDFKKEGLTAERLQDWMQRADWQKLLNTRGTTWRKLPESDREAPDAGKAKALMLAQPSLIKRPVVDTGKGLLVGFDPAAWQTTFK